MNKHKKQYTMNKCLSTEDIMPTIPFRQISQINMNNLHLKTTNSDNLSYKFYFLKVI